MTLKDVRAGNVSFCLAAQTRIGWKNIPKMGRIMSTPRHWFYHINNRQFIQSVLHSSDQNCTKKYEYSGPHSELFNKCLKIVLNKFH
jgi:hypothetical protein